jgi:filamentous hemagglutinin
VQGAETAAKNGDLGEYVGRGVGNLAVNVGSLFIPGADGAEVANLAAKGGEAAEMLGRAGSLANDAGKVAELGGDAGKLGDAAEHVGAAGAEAPGEVGLHAAPEPLPAPEVSRADIDSLRARMGVPDTNTVGVARTNVPGLQDEVFEGASAVPRREAGLPPAETGPIKSPNASPLFSNHAEEDIANQFVAAVDKAGLKPSDLDGKELLMRIQNEGGVCSICRQGLTNPKVPSGVLKQLSERYPGLNIHVVVDNPGPKLQGAADFVIRNGAYVK